MNYWFYICNIFDRWYVKSGRFVSICQNKINVPILIAIYIFIYQFIMCRFLKKEEDNYVSWLYPWARKVFFHTKKVILYENRLFVECERRLLKLKGDKDITRLRKVISNKDGNFNGECIKGSDSGKWYYCIFLMSVNNK